MYHFLFCLEQRWDYKREKRYHAPFLPSDLLHLALSPKAGESGSIEFCEVERRDWPGGLLPKTTDLSISPDFRFLLISGLISMAGLELERAERSVFRLDRLSCSEMSPRFKELMESRADRSVADALRRASPRVTRRFFRFVSIDVPFLSSKITRGRFATSQLSLFKIRSHSAAF